MREYSFWYLCCHDCVFLRWKCLVFFSEFLVLFVDVLYTLNQRINIVVCTMPECFCPQKESGLLKKFEWSENCFRFVKRYTKQSIKSQTFVLQRKKFEKIEILLYQNKISYYVIFGVELSLLGLDVFAPKTIITLWPSCRVENIMWKIPTSFIVPSEETFNWNLCNISNCFRTMLEFIMLQMVDS